MSHVSTIKKETVDSTLPANGFGVPDIYVEQGDKDEDPDRLFVDSLNTSGAEWYDSSEVGKEVMYLCVIMDQLGFTQSEPTEFHEDSRRVITMVENPVNRKVSRHIDTRRH